MKAYIYNINCANPVGGQPKVTSNHA